MVMKIPCTKAREVIELFSFQDGAMFKLEGKVINWRSSRGFTKGYYNIVLYVENGEWQMYKITAIDEKEVNISLEVPKEG
jgi:hypothetical protein